MALRETRNSPDTDLFRQELVNLLNQRHPLFLLAQKIDWAACERQFGGLYATGVGRLGHPIRLMVGLQLLKHICNVSDEEVVATWVENPYWQHFCGAQHFSHLLPIDPSLMTMLRKPIGPAGCEFILGLTVTAGLATRTVAKSSLAVVNVDNLRKILKKLRLFYVWRMLALRQLIRTLMPLQLNGSTFAAQLRGAPTAMRGRASGNWISQGRPTNRVLQGLQAPDATVCQTRRLRCVCFCLLFGGALPPRQSATKHGHCTLT